MEAKFTLDTSGRVAGHFEGLAVWYEFGDLSPFAQGYVEALFAEWAESLNEQGQELLSWRRGVDRVAFSDLSPEALAMILADCANDETRRDFADTRHGGYAFWTTRQTGMRGRFPPLTPYLGDDGKVWLKATGAAS